MNHSGSAVKKLVPQNEVAQLIVVHDDIDLGFGDLKVSVGRGDGSHNGVSSIIKELGNKSFTRVRIGIAPLDPDGNVRRPAGGGALERYVLGTFSAGERDQLPVLQAQAAAAIVCVVQEGAAAAMNTYNSN
jgi:PTH1 family peptidyl-tRNA hydrolase